MLKILTLYYCHWYVVLGTLFERYSTVLEKAVLAFSSRIVSYTHLTWQRTLSQFNPVYRSMGRFRNPNWRYLPCMYVCAHTYIYIYIHTRIIYIYTVYKAYVRAKFQGLCPENMPAIYYSTSILGSCNSHWIGTLILVIILLAPQQRQGVHWDV